jgi:hypothetical protein
MGNKNKDDAEHEQKDQLIPEPEKAGEADQLLVRAQGLPERSRTEPFPVLFWSYPDVCL